MGSEFPTLGNLFHSPMNWLRVRCSLFTGQLGKKKKMLKEQKVDDSAASSRFGGARKVPNREKIKHFHL